MLPPRRFFRPRKDDGNKKKEIKAMVGGNSRNPTTSESIPDELLFEILLRLPTQDIYHAAMLVCQKWYHMMRTKHFIQKHLQQASNGLLYKDRSGDAVFISAREDGGGIDTYRLNYILKSIGPMWSSCNGWILERESGPFYEFINSVTNVLTGLTFCLPPCTYPNIFDSISNGIGYDAASMRYKAVVSYKGRFIHECAILTVGVDKSWRRVRTDPLSYHFGHKIENRMIVTEGFVHWNTCGGTGVLTLNLETEIMAVTPPPIPHLAYSDCCLLSTGRYLSLFIRRKKLEWQVFEMKPETRKWRKLPNICLEGQEGRIIDDYLKPWGWLKYPEVLAFKTQRVIIFYNLITCEISAERLSSPEGSIHNYSMSWFKVIINS